MKSKRKSKESKSHLYETIKLGAIAGIRSVSAPAILSHRFANAPSVLLQNSPMRYLQSAKVATGLKFMAATEMLGDKVPGVPDRIKFPSLVTRAGSGALVGAALFKVSKKNGLMGAALGAFAAIASTYASFHLRKSITAYTAIPDVLCGLAEDALIVSTGKRFAKQVLV